MLKWLCCPRSTLSYNLTYVAQMELHNAPISSARQFFSSDLVTKTGKKSSRALHDEGKESNFETTSPHSVLPLGEFGSLLRHRIEQWRSFV